MKRSVNNRFSSFNKTLKLFVWAPQIARTYCMVRDWTDACLQIGSKQPLVKLENRSFKKLVENLLFFTIFFVSTLSSLDKFEKTILFWEKDLEIGQAFRERPTPASRFLMGCPDWKRETGVISTKKKLKCLWYFYNGCSMRRREQEVKLDWIN